jgi:hypothetical protein
MSYKYYNKKQFDLSEDYKVICETQNTRYGFRHVASLRDKYFSEVAKSKACYYNRTWESYTYQSVLKKVISAYFEGAEHEAFQKYADEYKEGSGIFTAVKAICAIGALECKSDKEKNAWDKKMFAAAGLDFPYDWDSLSEEEKKSRLDKVKSVI